MKCPFCGASDTKVVDTRTMEDNSVIRRRRFCPECSERFTTYERVDTIPLTVVKSDETRESFDRGKILKGMLMSCNKRPVSVEELEKVVLEERGREFYAETWRRNDLIRFGKFEDDWGYKNQYHPEAQTEKWRRIFPVSVGLMNSNTNWKQNYGY